MKLHVSHLVMVTAILLPTLATAEEYVITLKDHQFSPRELIVPANEKIRLTVKNLDTTPVEFESAELNREKIIVANSEVKVSIGPLSPGQYSYFDEFHKESTGIITAK